MWLLSPQRYKGCSIRGLRKYRRFRERPSAPFRKEKLFLQIHRKKEFPPLLKSLRSTIHLIIFISIFNSFSARTHRLNIFGNIMKNKVFIGIISFVIVMQVILIYKGGELFRTSGLRIDEFMVMLMFALTVIPVDFIRKMILKYRGKKLGV